jgi:hypothetical protein
VPGVPDDAGIDDTAFGLRDTAFGLRDTAFGLRDTAFGLRWTAFSRWWTPVRLLRAHGALTGATDRPATGAPSPGARPGPA